MNNLPHHRRMSDRQPTPNRFAEALLLALGVIVLVTSLALLFFAIPAHGATVEVQHPIWKLVCTLDSASYDCAQGGDCALTVHCHGGTLFTDGFEGAP